MNKQQIIKEIEKLNEQDQNHLYQYMAKIFSINYEKHLKEYSKK